MFRVTIYEKDIYGVSCRDTSYLNDLKCVVDYLEFRRTCVDQNIEDVFISDIGNLYEGD